jgi:mono/diheme cytochrome c family protein
MKKSILSFLSIGILVAGCGDEHMPFTPPSSEPTTSENRNTNQTPGQATGPTYEADIFPIFKRECSGCHNVQMMTDQGKNWLIYEQAYAKRDLIKFRIAIKKDMPLGGGTIKSEERELIAKWVDSGAARSNATPAAEKSSGGAPSSGAPVAAPATAPSISSGSLPSAPTGERSGKDIFGSRCNQCHLVQGEFPPIEGIGPELTWVGKKSTEYIRRSILQPSADIVADDPSKPVPYSYPVDGKKISVMPEGLVDELHLTERELDNLVGYLKDLGTTILPSGTPVTPIPASTPTTSGTNAPPAAPSQFE